MKILKIKSKIYQYTGIHLAKKEEEEFLDDDHENSQRLSLQRALWQVDHGFTSYQSRFRNWASYHRLLGNPVRYLLYRILNRVVIMYTQLKWDMGF